MVAIVTHDGSGAAHFLISVERYADKYLTGRKFLPGPFHLVEVITQAEEETIDEAGQSGAVDRSLQIIDIGAGNDVDLISRKPAAVGAVLTDSGADGLKAPMTLRSGEPGCLVPEALDGRSGASSTANSSPSYFDACRYRCLRAAKRHLHIRNAGRQVMPGN